MSEAPRKRRVVRTRAFDMGKPLINIDNVAEAHVSQHQLCGYAFAFCGGGQPRQFIP